MEKKISEAFMAFSKEAPEHAQAWGTMVSAIAGANKLDPKTTHLIYLAVLAALGMESGIPFHVDAAKKAGATRDEVIHSVLVGLPATGHRVTQALPAIIMAYDGE